MNDDKSEFVFNGFICFSNVLNMEGFTTSILGNKKIIRCDYETEKKGWVGLGLCCLMTPGLSKDVLCVTILFLNLQITR